MRGSVSAGADVMPARVTDELAHAHAHAHAYAHRGNADLLALAASAVHGPGEVAFAGHGFELLVGPDPPGRRGCSDERAEPRCLPSSCSTSAHVSLHPPKIKKLNPQRILRLLIPSAAVSRTPWFGVGAAQLGSDASRSRPCSMKNAARSARAAIVSEGLTDSALGTLAPSVTKRPG